VKAAAWGDAGRRRMALLGVAALAVASMAGAAQRSAPPPSTPSSAAPADVVRSGDRPLRVLARDTSAIVLGVVLRSEGYDDERLRVHRVRVERVLGGRADDAELGVVDLGGTGNRPPALVAGERVVALVRPAPALSYLAQHLPAGAYVEVVGGRDGIVPLVGDADVGDVERTLADGAAAARLPDVEREAAVRRLAFRELGTASSRLVADGVTELRGLHELRTISAPEAEIVAGVLRRPDVEATTRIRLLHVLAEQRPAGGARALDGVEAENAAVLDALLAADAALGGARARDALRPHLASDDPAARAAAVRALGRIGDPAAVNELERYATVDPDVGVRTAAIEALGATRQPAAIPVLARTFQAPATSLMQASARAMLALDGPAVDDALVGLALRGDSVEARRYAALVLVLSRGRTHPAVRQLESSNPPPEVRELLDHGVKDPHHHD
jgi:hypothetical protein